MDLLRTAHPDDPALDMAVTHALLAEVAEGARPATARIYRPGPTLAFGRLDAVTPGYPAAAAAARAHGFEPLLRLGGGHAAAYDDGSLVVDLIVPQDVVAEGITERFEAGTELVVDGLRRAGVDPRVGELPGEYCPGTWSVHAGGIKLAGAAQRSIRGASLTAVVVAAEHGRRLRDVLVDVYAALELDWDPGTAGAARDVVPAVTVGAVERGLREALADRYGPLPPAELSAATLERARGLRDRHAVAPPAPAAP